MIVVREQISGSPLRVNTLIIIATLLLSVVGYKLIEHPIRKLPIPVRFTQPIAISARSKVISFAASATVIALVFAVATGRIDLGSTEEVITAPTIQATATPMPTATTSSTPSPTASSSASAEPTALPTEVTSPTAQPTPPAKELSYSQLLDAFKEKVSDGNMLNSVPAKMSPTVSQLTPLRDAQWRTCMDVAVRAITCEFGNKSAAKTAVILGDSFALATYPTILGALDLSKWHVIGLNMRECMVADVVPFHWNEAWGVISTCAPHRDWTFSYLQEIKPDLIFISDQPYHPIAIGDKDSGDAHDQLWEEGLQRSMQTLKKLNSKIVYLGTPDSGWETSLVGCTNAQGELKKSCFGSVAKDRSYVLTQKSATEAVGGLFIDLKGWICDFGTCPPIIDNTPVFYDGAHFSEAFAAKIAPLLAALLREKNFIN
jgi:hypothetical protein